MNAQSEEIRLYFARVRPLYNELFSMAHVICGNYEQAEYALSSVILAGWNNRRHFRSERGFRENMRADLRRIALAQTHENAEMTWEPRPAQDEDGMAPSLASIQEDTEVVRAVMLRYGCELSVREVARVTGRTRRQTEQLLNRFLRRFRRRQDDHSAKPEALIQEMCREELACEAEAPDIGAVFRTFEAEATQNYRPGKRLAGRVAAFCAYIALILLLACAIWLCSALIRPPQIAQDGLLVETLNEQ